MDRNEWDYDPFGGEILPNGYIVGRGTQDMKCVTIQYIEALRRLKDRKIQPLRSIHIVIVPDEEIGGRDGMATFLKTPEFQQMQPIALALDEGLANPTEEFTVFYGERSPWWVYINAEGATGHASRFITDTAVEKLMKVCQKALEFRKQEEEKLQLEPGCKHSMMKKKTLGDVTTLNLTVLQAGVSSDEGKSYAFNVIPASAKAGFDVRISPSLPFEEFEQILDEWCAEEGVTWSYADTNPPLHKHAVTSIDPEENFWWKVFQKSCKSNGLQLQTEIFPAASDSRYLRQLGIPALGFSPMNNTPILLHEHNEMLHKDVFLRGISVYENLLIDLTQAEE